MSTELFAVGVNHKHAPVELRERLAVGDDEHGALLRALREHAGLSEAMIVSTCNRVEIYGVAPTPDAAWAVLDVLASLRALEPALVREHGFLRGHADAARHVFRVASSLESLVVGEPQILGQVKGALGRARESGMVGPVLDRCMSLAFKCAKRVRSETDIARGGASVPSVAVDLARSIFGELTGCAVAVLGAGEMAEQAALHLQAAGAAEIVVVNRSAERGQALAAKVQGRYEPVLAHRQALQAAIQSAEVRVQLKNAKATGKDVLLGDQMGDIARDKNTIPEAPNNDYTKVRDDILIEAQQGQVTPPLP